MAEKKRNHYVPRFLLNHFASRREKNKHWVWQYRRDEVPIEISTRDVAVESFFYGRDPGLEKSLGEVEQQMKPVLDQILTGAPVSDFALDLANFVYLLGVRTRALRLQIADSANEVFTELFSEATIPLIEKAVRKEADGRYDEEINKIIAAVPRNRRKVALKLARQRLPKATFLQMIDERLGQIDLRAVLVSQGKQMIPRINFQAAAEDGQLKGLTRLLDAQKTPDPLLNAVWKLVTQSSGAYVLGDACVIATQDSKVGSLFRFGSTEWAALYLPLTPRHLLVAYRNEPWQIPQPDQINEYSAQLAENAIFCCEDTEETRRLSLIIGSGYALIEPSETTRLVNEIWRDLAG